MTEIFVAMPFDPTFDSVFDRLFQPAISYNDAFPYRVDRNNHLDNIDAVIEDRIRSSPIMLADISGLNPNVLHELGFARALNKTLIICASDAFRNQRIPFDIHNNPILYYRNNSRDSRDELSNRIRAAIEREVVLQIPLHIKKKVDDTNNMDQYFADRINEAKKEVCSLLWQDDEDKFVVLSEERKIIQDNITNAIGRFCSSNKGIYRELFTFSYSPRYDFMMSRLPFGRNYQCRYFDSLGIPLKERFPKLQFRIIDDEEVFFASRSSQGHLCAIKDKDLVFILQQYFNEAWNRAIIIGSGGRSPEDIFDKIKIYH